MESYWLRMASFDNNVSKLAILMQSDDPKHFFLPSLFFSWLVTSLPS